MLFLHELAIVPRESGGTEASVPLHRVAVDALAAVVTRVVQALVAVHAALAVVGHLLAPRTPLFERALKVGYGVLVVLVILKKKYK